ncbi:beta-lactamase-like protein [Aspergillus varians]
MGLVRSIALLALLCAPALGKRRPPLNEFFTPPTFPNEQKANVTQYLNEAAAFATDSAIHQYFQDQCIVQQLYPRLLEVASGFVKPFAAFDNLYFIGESAVSSWAYNTTEGVVVIDSLDRPDEVETILLPGLEAFGLRGEDIKHLIITHEHDDHYGGAKYIQDTFKPVVYASEKAWQGLEALGPDDPPAPTRDRVLGDGDNLTVGDVTFHFVATPGHTPGTLSLIFPVVDNGMKHLAGLSGGTGTPTDAPSREDKFRSQYRFADIAKQKGVDTLISNHHVADHALWHADLLAHRAPGGPNPFVIGVDNFDKYMRINAISSKLIAAREGQNLQV